MPAWRATLTDRTIRQLDLLPGKPSALAAWTQTGQVTFFDLHNGALLGERSFADAPEKREGDAWQAFLSTLTAPNQAHLPLVWLEHMTIHTAADGRMRLVQVSASDLFLTVDGKETHLDNPTGASFSAVGLDRSLGLIAALDSAGKLHIYQQHMRVGTFDIGLDVRAERTPGLAVAYGGSAVFITDGERLVLTDPGGRVRKQIEMHYPLGSMTCSPDGHLVATGDVDIGVIRIYNGTTLAPTHQRFASDLIGEARRAQLTAALPGHAALGPLVLSDRGNLAFAIAGAICATNITRMSVLPKA